MEYKRFQAELDDINNGLADVDKELNHLEEGSPQFMVCTFLSEQLSLVWEMPYLNYSCQMHLLTFKVQDIHKQDQINWQISRLKVELKMKGELSSAWLMWPPWTDTMHDFCSYTSYYMISPINLHTFL